MSPRVHEMSLKFFLARDEVRSGDLLVDDSSPIALLALYQSQLVVEIHLGLKFYHSTS